MNDTAHYKKLLEAEKVKLESELQTVGRRNPSNPHDWVPALPSDPTPEADPIDVADFATKFDTNASIVADLETRYNHVQSALERIEKGTYGVCSVCGKDIEQKRLDADPAAATCVAHLNSK